MKDFGTRFALKRHNSGSETIAKSAGARTFDIFLGPIVTLMDVFGKRSPMRAVLCDLVMRNGCLVMHEKIERYDVFIYCSGKR